MCAGERRGTGFGCGRVIFRYLQLVASVDDFFAKSCQNIVGRFREFQQLNRK